MCRGCGCFEMRIPSLQQATRQCTQEQHGGHNGLAGYYRIAHGEERVWSPLSIGDDVAYGVELELEEKPGNNVF